MVLIRLVKEGIDEQTVVTHFLHHLAGSAASSQLSRQSKRVIAKAYKDVPVEINVVKAIEASLKVQYSDADTDDKYDIPTFLRRSG
jgi:hypothetical protein